MTFRCYALTKLRFLRFPICMLNVYLSFQNLELIGTIQILCQLVAQGLLSQGQPDLSASSCVSAAEVALHVTGAPSGEAAPRLRFQHGGRSVTGRW